MNFGQKEKLIIFTIFSFLMYIFSNGQWSIPIFTWIYPILFLYMLNLYRSNKVCLLIYGIYVVGFVVQFENVIGMGFWLCVAVAILISALKTLPYLFYLKSTNNFGTTITFAAAMVTVEYIVYCIYPILGGLSDAYTQCGNALLIQLITITGIYGITFITYWTAAVMIWLWSKRKELQQVKRYIYIYGTVIMLIFSYGVMMLQFTEAPQKSVRVAGITEPVSQLLNEDEDVYAVFYTNSFTDKNLLRAKEKLNQVTDKLFRKTLQEAQAGAKIVFWSELNGSVLEEDEAALLKKASDMAKEQGIYFIVSLLVKTPYEDLKENKTVAFGPKGEQISEYFKSGRSIGELCQKGDGEIKSFDTEYGRIAPFICSDMAFSAKIQQAGKNNVDILIVPASDWKEMTTIALKTAIVRGIENGCNIVRHTNRGKSVATDFCGTVLASTDYFQSETKTMVAQVPTNGRFTIYSYIGNVFDHLCGIFIVVTFVLNKKTKVIE